MHLTILYSAQWAFSELELPAANTPFWVPLTILILMILLFVWGLTRGNVLDENLPNMEGSAAEKAEQLVSILRERSLMA